MEISNLCRLCLGRDGDDRSKLSLFDSPELRGKIETLLKIIIEVRGCTQTPMVCRKCADKVASFSSFQELALKNHQKYVDQKLTTAHQIMTVMLIKNELDEDSLESEDLTFDSSGEFSNTGELREGVTMPKKKGRQKGTTLNHMDVPYNCSECELKYATLNSLLKHCEADHPGVKVECYSCKATLHGRSTLSYHQQICQFYLGIAKQEFTCSRCPRKFFSRSILTKHLKMCGKTDAFTCRHCDKTFDRIVFVNEHEKICDKAPAVGEDLNDNIVCTFKEEAFEMDDQVKPKRRKKDKSEYYIMGSFLCTDCEFSTTNFNSLKKHCSTKHPECKKTCPGCNIVMCGEGTLKAHKDLCKFIQTDVVNFWQCEKACNQKFDKMAGFAAHMKVCGRDGPEKPSCPKCNKQLARGGSYGLKTHMEKCDGSPANYSCCDTDFASFRPFLQHKKQVHQFEIDETSETCPMCEKVLKTPALMMMHVRNRHFSNRCNDTFPCPIEGCGKILMQKKSLVQHLDNHEKNFNREVFTCDVCGKTFFSRSGLLCHKCADGVSPFRVISDFFGADSAKHYSEESALVSPIENEYLDESTSPIHEGTKEDILDESTVDSSHENSKENNLDEIVDSSHGDVCKPNVNEHVIPSATFAWAEVDDNGEGCIYN